MPDAQVSSEAYIIRRIPPSDTIDFVIERPDKSLRPTSASLSLREGETGLSCSQADITSPEALLAQIQKSAEDGWMVAAWKVKDLPDGLDVIITPSDPPSQDPGHCEIRPKPGVTYSGKLRCKLAKAGTVVFPPRT